MEKELTYYKNLSGLPDGKSLYDYQYSYFNSLVSMGPKATLDDMKSEYYFRQTGLQNNEDAEFAYFHNLVGTAEHQNTISDLKRIVFNM
jgi:hypothetical protein